MCKGKFCDQSLAVSRRSRATDRAAWRTSREPEWPPTDEAGPTQFGRPKPTPVWFSEPSPSQSSGRPKARVHAGPQLDLAMDLRSSTGPAPIQHSYRFSAVSPVLRFACRFRRTPSKCNFLKGLSSPTMCDGNMRW
jgi:hypothetical protein